MNQNLTLLVLAAGMGSRFGGLKQIEPIGPSGEFMIDYSVYDAIKAGFNKIVFLIKEENYEVFKETIGARVEPRIKVEYAFQKNDNIPAGYNVPEDRVKPFGTGHAIYCAKDKINEKFAIISADDFFGADAFQQAADFAKESDDFCVIGYKIGGTLSEQGTVKRGVCMEKDGYLTDVIESKATKVGDIVKCEPLSGAEPYEIGLDHPVSMLMFGLTPVIFEELEKQMNEFFEANKDDLSTCEFLFPDVLSRMIKEDKIRIKVLPTSAKWFGATYREDLDNIKNSIRELIAEGAYKEDLWS